MGDTPARPLPEIERKRLETLRAYDLLDTLPEQAYDDITLLAALIADTPIALISLIDDDRQWFKSRVGLDVTETPRDLAFCAHAICSPARLLVVPDATLDARFSTNALVTGEPDIRFYAGAPLVTSNGAALGTLCVIDRKPRELTARQLDALRALSRQVMVQLELRQAVGTLRENAVAQAGYERELETYQRELERANASLQSESLTDGLTSLANRRAFQLRLAEEVQRAGRYPAPLSLLMVDVDNFKSYNDDFGHQAGDAALAGLAPLLRQNMRDSDVAARYGGEEFAVVLPQTEGATALVLAERLRRTVKQASWSKRPVSVSVGVATLQDGMGAEELVGAADAALYAAKQRGRNCVVAASGHVPPRASGDESSGAP